MRGASAWIVGVLFTGTCVVQGAHVATMDVPTMADHAGAVIMGEVASVRSYWADSPRRIESEITFREVAYLKGEPARNDRAFSLVVPGGTVGTMQMRICCAPAFEEGQRWVLFLLPTYKTFPVVGLYRGALRVRPDESGIDRVYDAAGLAVTGLDAEGFIASPIAHATSQNVHLVDASNIRVMAEGDIDKRPTQAVRYVDFVKTLKPLLDASRQHRLTEPVGTRIVVEYRAVPLKTAPDAAANAPVNEGSLR